MKDFQTKGMAYIQYKIRTQLKNKMSTIFMRFSDKRGIDETLPLPLKVNSDNWSNKTERYSEGSKLDINYLLNRQEKYKIETELETIRLFIFDKYNTLLKSNEDFTKEWLKSIVDSYYNKETSKVLNLNQYIEKFIKDAETGERLYDHNGRTKRYEKGTIKNFKGFQVQFTAYQTDKRVKLNFNAITIDFYDDYVKYFTKKDYSINTYRATC